MLAAIAIALAMGVDLLVPEQFAGPTRVARGQRRAKALVGRHAPSGLGSTCRFMRQIGLDD